VGSAVGILGGTFDPVHVGHLAIAEEVRRKLRLEEVLFMPAGQPWLKQRREITPAQHRLEMVMLATAPNPRFEVSTLELERPGATYTVDTMTQLRASLNRTRDLFFIVGFDSLADLPKWKEPERLLKLCRVAAVRRPGHTELDVDGLEAAVPGFRKSLVVVDAPLLDICASEIRRRVAEGLLITDMVPEAVARYIAQNDLYR
jgi:nicotinate-nucleotide adenylyltransferase